MQSRLTYRLILCSLCMVTLQQAQTPPTLQPIATGLGAAIGMDFDAVSGRLYVAEFSGSISVIDVLSGNRQVIGSGYTLPEDIKLAPDRQYAYVTERAGNLLRINLANADRSAAEVINSDLASPHQIALSPDGRFLFTVEFEPPGRLLRVDLSTRQTVEIATGLQQAVGVIVRSDLSYALVSEQAGDGRISRVSPLTPRTTAPPLVTPLTTNLPSLFFLTWADSAQQRILVPQRDPYDRVVAIDVNNPGQAVSIVENVPFRPSSVVSAPNSQLYIASETVISRFGPTIITSLNPASVIAGAPAFTLTVNGAGFAPGAVVQWNGMALPTTFVNAVQLNATVAANLIASAGTAVVAVVSGEATSNGVNFPIAPRPAITSLSPIMATAGGPPFTLTVNGDGFTPGAVVQWNGMALPTTFVNAMQLNATVAANLIANAGTAAITVVSGGVTSNSVNFPIAPRPAITSLNPAMVTAGGPVFTLTVNGSNFAPGAVVQWNGQPLSTTFANPTLLTAIVPAERTAIAGTANITVISQGSTTAAVAFIINARPNITSLSPNSRTAGTPGFTLTVNGSGFAPDAVVQWNGQPLPTTFSNPGQISAAVTADRIANAGTVNITVVSREVTTAPVVFQISALPAITTAPALPPATAGSAYSQRLQATGGTGAYTDWVVLNGSLPAGLNLDRASGMISGTPAAESFASFTVQVTDSSGSRGTKLFSLQVLAGGPPSVSIAPESILLEIAGGAIASERNISVQVRGAGSLPVRAEPAGTPWLSVTPSTGTATAATPLSLAVQVNAIGLAAGTQFGRITVTAGDTASVVPVTVVIRPAPRPTLQLSQGGLQFKAASGVRSVPAQQFAVINSGQGLLMWSTSAEALSGGPSWLSISPPAGSSDASNPSAPLAEVRVNPAGLAPGNYYGQIRVSAPDATNRLQILTVALSVLPPEQRVEPVVLPTGLIFLAPLGATPPAAQDVIASNVGRSEITFTTEASSSDGQVWFTHTPATSVVPPEGSVRVAVRPATAPLQAGIRRGSLVFTFSDGAKRSIDLLVVAVSSSSGANALAGPAANGGCQANQLIPVFTTLSSLAGFPVALRSSQSVRVRAVEIGANCAQFVTSGSMWLDVTDGSSTPGQHESEGVWAANWTPLTAGLITVKSTVANATGLSGQAEITAQAAQDPASVLPVTQSVTNGASYVLGQPVAPGSWIAIKGAELAVVDRDLSNQVPYPMDLSGTSVFLGEQVLPVYFVSRQQINALLPFNVPVDTFLSLQVRRQGVPSEARQVTVAQPQPAIFTADATGSGQGSILIAGTTLLAAPASAGSRPARRGEFISIYGAGLGAVDNPPGPGAPGPVNPLARVIGPVSVQIGGRPASVTFAGLAPGFVGLYQVDTQVPQDSPAGDRVPVVIIQGSVQTPPVTMAVE